MNVVLDGGKHIHVLRGFHCTYEWKTAIKNSTVTCKVSSERCRRYILKNWSLFLIFLSNLS